MAEGDSLLPLFHCAENGTKTNSNVQPLVARPARACLKNPIRTKEQSNDFLFLLQQSDSPQLVLRSSAQRVHSMALAHRLSAPLLALAQAHLPLAQHSYASDRVFPCP